MAIRQLEKLNCKYGAPMGRPGWNQEDRESPKIRLQRIRLDSGGYDSGGYDSGGAYWGHGQPIWWAWSDGDELNITLRASSREAVKVKVREEIPGARFYR
jgi:hypothetical protein